MHSILIVNPKGGCGKTTIATNLAAHFANADRPVWLADADAQRAALDWLARRPYTAPEIEGLDWTREPGEPPRQDGVLVIDAPAALDENRATALVALADSVVVPVMPSPFDQETTAAFLKWLATRRRRPLVAVLRNRVRRRTRAAARLDLFMVAMGQRDLGGLPDRAAYADLAARGLGVFDLRSKRGVALRADWAPLVEFVSGQGEALTKRAI